MRTIFFWLSLPRCRQITDFGLHATRLFTSFTPRRVYFRPFECMALSKKKFTTRLSKMGRIALCFGTFLRFLSNRRHPLWRLHYSPTFAPCPPLAFTILYFGDRPCTDSISPSLILSVAISSHGGLLRLDVYTGRLAIQTPPALALRSGPSLQANLRHLPVLN